MVENRDRCHRCQALTHVVSSARAGKVGLWFDNRLPSCYRVPPSPPGSTGIIELAGICPQNPHDKGLRGHNLESKGVAGRFLARSGRVAFTEFIAFAWA